MTHFFPRVGVHFALPHFPAFAASFHAVKRSKVASTDCARAPITLDSEGLAFFSLSGSESILDPQADEEMLALLQEERVAAMEHEGYKDTEYVM